MKKGKGKNKGSEFERTISRAIDQWWEVPDGTFWRTTNSGGWKEPGDIAPRQRQHQEPVWWPFVVECKFYKKIEFWNLFKEKNKKHKLIQWWRQVTDSQSQAIKQGRKPEEAIRLLIFKENSGQVFVMTAEEDIGPFYFGSPLWQVNVSNVFNIPVLILTWEVFCHVYAKEEIYKHFGKT